MANCIIVTGRLTADPELRQTPDGTPVTSFSIAVPRKFKKDTTDFLDAVAWRKNAEFLCKYFSKGKWVEVAGSLQTRTYQDKEGKNRKAVEIVADEINFVGDKLKEDGSPANNATAPPPPPASFDPFAKSAPAHASDGPGDFAEFDEDGDLPF